MDGDVVCYLTLEAVRKTEEFQLNSLRTDVDLKPFMQRLHMCVTAIQEYLQANGTYSRLGRRSWDGDNGVSQGYEEWFNPV